VPEPLVPWIDWVLRDVPNAGCPISVGAWDYGTESGSLTLSSLPDEQDERPCIWISSLELIVEARGAAFRQEVFAFRDTWTELPGDSRLWPEEVQLDGKPAPAIGQPNASNSRELPSARVPAGRHRLVGRIRWDERPEGLAIPGAVALTRLSLDGSRIPFPLRPRADQLRFGLPAKASEEADGLEVSVHRLLTDGVPISLETRLSLRVAGKSRELGFERPLPAGFRFTRIDSTLPTRLDPDGSLRIEARAGRFEVVLHARAEGRTLEARHPDPKGIWDSSEVWSFAPDPTLRWVEVTGVPNLDPQQTEAPEEWRDFAAYLLEPGASLRIEERRRAGTDERRDRLELSRTLWLDFDGRGYSVRDDVSGTLESSRRLEIGSAFELGRVAIAGVDQPITRLSAESPAGVELRTKNLRLQADARLVRGPASPGEASRAQRPTRVPVLGWSGGFDQASVELRLPPGWTAFHVSGADRVAGTWVSGWTLLEMFLVLITALAIAQLFGRIWGAVALASLLVTFQEADAPRYIWLIALAATALLSVVPEGRLSRSLARSQLGIALILAWIAIPFAIQQAQQALYPALELHSEPGASMWKDTPVRLEDRSGEDDAFETAAREAPAAPPERRREPESAPKSLSRMAPSLTGQLQIAAPKEDLSDRPDPNSVTATGMGIPSWTWRTTQLGWSGPITGEQSFHPYLLPPSVNRLLSLSRVAALIVLAGLSLVGPSALGRALRFLDPRAGRTTPPDPAPQDRESAP